MNKYRFEVIDETTFDDFATIHPMNSIFQNSAWSKVKSNWECIYVAVFEKNIIVAAALVLLRPIKLNIKFGYINNGPLIDFNDTDLVSFFFQNLKLEMRKKKVLFVKVDPKHTILHTTVDQKELVKDYRDERFVSLLKNCGLKHSGYTMSLHETIQPRIQMTFVINDNIDTTIGSKTMKKVRASIRKGVNFKFERKAENLAHLINYTENRHDIKLRDESYFQSILDNFKNDAVVLTAYFEGVPISSCLLVKSKDTCEILYSGYDDDFKHLKSTYPMRYKAIEYAKEKECSYFNFGGVDGSLDDGLTIFKSSFRPKVYVYIGEFESYPFGYISKLAAYIYKIMKKK